MSLCIRLGMDGLLTVVSLSMLQVYYFLALKAHHLFRQRDNTLSSSARTPFIVMTYWTTWSHSP